MTQRSKHKGLRELISQVCAKHHINDAAFENQLANLIIRFINGETELEKLPGLLPTAPVRGGRPQWPVDVIEYAEAFEDKFGREAVPDEKGYWIRVFRKSYIATGITVDEMRMAFDLCKAMTDMTIKSPKSIFFKADEIHRKGMTSQKATAIYE